MLTGFKKDEDQLLPEHEAALNEMIERLQADGVTDYSVPSIIGGASQTGPEVGNVDLSRTRADRVAGYLDQHGLDVRGYSYHGSSRPNLDLPGEECAANRYVIVEYHSCSDRALPLVEDDLDDDLEAEFSIAKKWVGVPRSERPRDEEGNIHFLDPTLSIERCEAKSKYLLGRSFADLAGKVDVSDQVERGTPVWYAFGKEAEGFAKGESRYAFNRCIGSMLEDTKARVTLEESRELWLDKAFTHAMRNTEDLLETELVTSRWALIYAPAYRDRLLAEYHEECRDNLYFRHTYCGPEAYRAEDGTTQYRWPQEWRNEADRIERRVFGDVTDCAPSQTLWDYLKRAWEDF